MYLIETIVNLDRTRGKSYAWRLTDDGLACAGDNHAGDWCWDDIAES